MSKKTGKAKGPSVVYLDKEDAAIVRKKKTKHVERVLTEMVKEHGGISPQMIVDEASDPGHELHKYFEWDDSLAAAKYRLSQATQMILATRFVCMLVEKRDKDNVLKAIDDAGKHRAVVRKFLPDFSSDGVFRDRAEVLSEEETRKALIERKIGVLRSWCNSVIDIDELAGTRDGILGLIG
jgi:hypothetical protein